MKSVVCILILIATSLLGACSRDSGNSNPASSPRAQTAAVQAGCYSVSYAGYGSSQIGCGLLQSFGDPAFDQAFAQEVQLQSAFWNGNSATIYAFDECPGQMNALSFPQHFILFGRNLVVSTIVNTGNTLAIAGELAHEWGHQIQFNNGYNDPNASTSRTTELEADAFGGYYLGLSKGWAGAQLNSYLQTLSSLGTYDFTDPSFHGTPNERSSAGALGLMVAAQVMQTNIPLSYDQLHSIFVNSAPIAVRATVRSATQRATPATVPSAMESQVMNAIDQDLITRISRGEASVSLRSPFRQSLMTQGPRSSHSSSWSHATLLM